MKATPSIEYEKDFHAWALHNADLIRQGRFSEADAENIAEELEDMGRSERQQLENRLRVLIAHLLKWKFQPERRSNSWSATVEEQRISIARLIKRNPSLKASLPSIFEDAYPLGLLLAIRETNLDKKTFPLDNPFSLDQTLNTNFWPG